MHPNQGVLTQVPHTPHVGNSVPGTFQGNGAITAKLWTADTSCPFHPLARPSLPSLPQSKGVCGVPMWRPRTPISCHEERTVREEMGTEGTRPCGEQQGRGVPTSGRVKGDRGGVAPGDRAQSMRLWVHQTGSVFGRCRWRYPLGIYTFKPVIKVSPLFLCFTVPGDILFYLTGFFFGEEEGVHGWSSEAASKWPCLELSSAAEVSIVARAPGHNALQPWRSRVHSIIL